MRTQVFSSYNSSELSTIIMGFESIYKEDGEKIEGYKYNGLVISLEGGINGKPEGTLFNISKWIKGEFSA